MKVSLVEAPEWAAALFPKTQIMFEHLRSHPAGDFAWRRNGGSLMVLCSARVEADGKRWMHVSCSHPSKLPSWDELVLVKESFIGRERMAIQVLPQRSKHVNEHPYVLHLWSCLDGDPAPDFRGENGLI